MRVKCLSIQNPLSYLVCAGIKDVENRRSNTKYRGTIYIHSCGEYCYPGLMDLSFLPLPVYNEYFEITNEEGEFLEEGHYFDTDFDKKEFFLKDAENQPDAIIREYLFFAYIYEMFKGNPAHIFFRNKAIIRKVDIVDVVNDSDSEWATDERFHWIFDNAVLFENPVLNVRGRYGFWEYEVPDDLEPAELVK